MRVRSIALIAAFVLVAALPAYVAAAPKASEYHGTWTSGVYAGCTNDSYGGPRFTFASRGTWDVTIDGPKVEVAATIEANFNDGYGWFPVDSFSGTDHGTWQVVSHGGPYFHLRIASDTLGNQEDLMLTGRQLMYRIQPYVFPGFLDCQFGAGYGELTSAK